MAFWSLSGGYRVTVHTHGLANHTSVVAGAGGEQGGMQMRCMVGLLG